MMKACVVLLAMTEALPTAALSQRVGVSQADLPSYRGAFIVENQTGVTIQYQVKWGSDEPWKLITLNSGQQETHSYPLGANQHARVPTPYVRFDRIGGDGQFTPKEYRMEFYAVGYAGFGPRTNPTQPKHYYFHFAADRKTLDILAQ